MIEVTTFCIKEEMAVCQEHSGSLNGANCYTQTRHYNEQKPNRRHTALKHSEYIEVKPQGKLLN